MILTLALLLILIQTPVWLLMIVAPHTRLTTRISEGYEVFIALGVVYIFFVVALLVYALQFNNAALLALTSIPSDAAKINAETMKPVLDAVKLSAGVQPALIGALLATTVLDLAGGLLAFRDMTLRQVPGRTMRGMLLVMFLLGPVGMLVYGAWHYMGMGKAKITPVIDPKA